MIATITSPEDAEKALRFSIGNPKDTIIFDLKPGLKLRSIPCIIRRCGHGCGNEYIGWNIWGKGDFGRQAVYCQKCGYAMDVLAQIDTVIQGGNVLLLSWRHPDEEDFFHHNFRSTWRV
jgi:hypothetical protein